MQANWRYADSLVGGSSDRRALQPPPVPESSRHQARPLAQCRERSSPMAACRLQRLWRTQRHHSNRQLSESNRPSQGLWGWHLPRLPWLHAMPRVFVMLFHQSIGVRACNRRLMLQQQDHQPQSASARWLSVLPVLESFLHRWLSPPPH